MSSGMGHCSRSVKLGEVIPMTLESNDELFRPFRAGGWDTGKPRALPRSVLERPVGAGDGMPSVMDLSLSPLARGEIP